MNGNISQQQQIPSRQVQFNDTSAEDSPTSNTTGGTQEAQTSPIEIHPDIDSRMNVWPRSWTHAIDTSIISPSPKKPHSLTHNHEEHEQTNRTQARSIPTQQQVNQWPRSWKAATDVTTNSITYSVLSVASSRVRNDSAQALGTPNSYDIRIMNNSLDTEALSELLIQQDDKIVSFREHNENERLLQNYDYGKEGYTKLPSQEQPPKTQDLLEVTEGGGSSMFATILNGMNLLCGIGMLATPYAVAVSGTGSLVIVALLAIACCFTGVLLRKSMDNSGPWCQAYPDIGLAAFGKTGRIAVAIMLCLELISCSVEVIILGGQNLAQLTNFWYYSFGGIIPSPQIFWYIATGVILMPLAWIQDMKWLSLASSGGILSSIIIMTLVFSLGVTKTSFDQLPGPFLRWDGVLVAIGLYCFCFSGHSVFPNLYRSLQNPKKFNPSIMIVFLCVTILYVAMGLIGYNTFGYTVAQQITMSMTIRYPHAIPSQIAGWLVMINPFTSYPLFLSPVALVLEELFPQNLKKFKQFLSSIGIRTCLVAFTVIIAISVPFFAYFGSLVGCILSVTISYILPCLFYMRICRMNGVKIGKLVFALCVVVPVIGFIVGSIGTYNSICAILNANSDV